MQADNPEYTESSAGEYLRSYDTEDDALGHQQSGFLWTGAQAAGKTVARLRRVPAVPDQAGRRDLAEPVLRRQEHGRDRAADRLPDWTRPRRSRRSTTCRCTASRSSTPASRTSTGTQIWKQDFEKNGPANLNMFWLSSDHTGGPASPAAQVADNDLAVGKMVDDDLAQQVLEGLGDLRRRGRLPGRPRPRRRPPRADPDHQPLGPARRGRQPLLLADHDDPHHRADPRDPPDEPEGQRGHPDDRRRSPRKPNFTPFTAVPNRTSLTAGLATPPVLRRGHPGRRRTRPRRPRRRPTVPARQKARSRRSGTTWKSHQRLTGPNAVPDYANPAQMNHFTWYQTHNWTKPYPGESKIYAPNDVPGAYIPSSESDG